MGLPRRCISDHWLNTEMDIVNNSYYTQFVNLQYPFFQFVISCWLYPLVVHVSTVCWFQIYDIWPVKTMRRCKLSWQLGVEQEELAMGPIENYIARDNIFIILYGTCIQHRLIYSTCMGLPPYDMDMGTEYTQLWSHTSKHLLLTSLFSLVSHPPSGAPPVCTAALHAVSSMMDDQQVGPQSVNTDKNNLLSANSWL